MQCYAVYMGSVDLDDTVCYLWFTARFLQLSVFSRWLFIRWWW